MKKLRKILSVFLNVAFTLLLILGVALLALRAMGYKLYAVKTQSMQNIYPAGTLIITDSTAAEDIEVGDVISFTVAKNTVVTHRVTKNDTENELIYTKGDMNDSEDSSPIAYDNVLGCIVFGIPYIGNAALYLRKKYVKIALIVLLALLAIYLIVSLIIKIVAKIKGRRNK
ncbi:MAG: signal peptidase I [Ruminococcus sp.]|nr:signal peptidase I [Ruminococcus sp.]